MKCRADSARDVLPRYVIYKRPPLIRGIRQESEVRQLHPYLYRRPSPSSQPAWPATDRPTTQQPAEVRRAQASQAVPSRASRAEPSREGRRARGGEGRGRGSAPAAPHSRQAACQATRLRSEAVRQAGRQADGSRQPPPTSRQLQASVSVCCQPAPVGGVPVVLVLSVRARF